MKRLLSISTALAFSAIPSFAQTAIPGRAVATWQGPLQCENAPRRLLSIAKMEEGGRIAMLFHEGKWLQMNGTNDQGGEHRFEDKSTGTQLSIKGREVVLENQGAALLKCVSIAPLELP